MAAGDYCVRADRCCVRRRQGEDVPKSQARMQDKISQLKGEVASEQRKMARAKSGRADDTAGGDTESKLRAQIKSLKEDLDRRQASYIRRERDYRTRVELLEAELGKAKKKRTQQLDADDHMEVLRDMHTNILGNIEHVQEQTSRILAENERDLLRAFRARLFDVQTELEKEKARAEDGAAVWIEKNRQLEKELDWAKEMADRLDRHNQALTRENGRLKTQFKTQEDDRNYLIHQLVAAKKDNQRLRQELTRVKGDLETANKQIADASGGGDFMAGLVSGGGSTPSATGPAAMAQSRLASLKRAPPNAQEENRYKDIIRRLKKLLEVERKNLRQVRTAFAAELQQRTELEIFLRQCIEDVKHDISRRRQQLMMSGGGTSSTGALPPVGSRPGSGSGRPSDVPLSSFASTDRERVMELLLSQERFVACASPYLTGQPCLTRLLSSQRNLVAVLQDVPAENGGRTGWRVYCPEWGRDAPAGHGWQRGTRCRWGSTGRRRGRRRWRRRVVAKLRLGWLSWAVQAPHRTVLTAGFVVVCVKMDKCIAAARRMWSPTVLLRFTHNLARVQHS